jgi:hypothetical protein
MAGATRLSREKRAAARKARNERAAGVARTQHFRDSRQAGVQVRTPARRSR